MRPDWTQFKLLLLLANMQTKGSSLRNQCFFSHLGITTTDQCQFLYKGQKVTFSTLSKSDATDLRGEGLGSLEVQVHPGRLKRGERQMTQRAHRMGFPQEEKNPLQAHRALHTFEH